MSTFHSPCTSTLEMEAACSSKMLASNYHTTQHNNPENYEFYLHCSRNLKSCMWTHVQYEILHPHGLPVNRRQNC
jgi:hypothetical protein